MITAARRKKYYYQT